MGFYLNSRSALTAYRQTARSKYFVDKSMLLEKIFPLIGQMNHDICITRPRRFGKTVMAQMVAAFFGSAVDNSEVFDPLRISGHPDYKKHLNKYQVVFIDFSKMPRDCRSYHQYICKIEDDLLKDLMRAYPEAELDEQDAVWDAFTKVYNAYDGESFFFVLDEWDCIFHKDFIGEEDRRDFVNFLACLIKDQTYVLFTYMTGVLPIAKYSSGSTINNFDEYDMSHPSFFSEYFGFTEGEVDELYHRYASDQENPAVSREDLARWYDGYRTRRAGNLYNPRSVIAALSRNELGSYWTNTGSFAEIAAYIDSDVDGVKRDVAVLAAGEPVKIHLQEYAAAAMRLDTRDRILSAMVVYGFLTYEERTQTVRIPNRELMDEFAGTIREEAGTGYIYSLAQASGRILKATLEGDEETVEEIISYVHNTEAPIFTYNSEEELAAVVNLAYLAARDSYDVVREDRAGKGYVDFIFLPYDPQRDGIILELKKDDSPENALRQIRERNYALRLKGPLGGRRRCGRIVSVGLTYDSRDKKKPHHCLISTEEFSKSGS